MTIKQQFMVLLTSLSAPKTKITTSNKKVVVAVK